MHRGERWSWLLLGVIVGSLVLLATGILAYGYWADRQVADCRDGMAPGSESWDSCATAGDFNG